MIPQSMSPPDPLNCVSRCATGVLASWCNFAKDLRPLYIHLHDAGLEHIDRSVEKSEEGGT
jgi:hypothetical protein